MLGARRRVLKSEGNLNSEIGLPMTVLNGLEPRPHDEIAVLEMAMYQVGDIRLLARLARPRIGVVTAVLPVHLERLGTIERIQQAKQELVEELPSNGVAVLNADDPRVAQMATATPARVVRYGVAENADVRAEHIESHGLRGVEFDLLHAGKRRHVHLPLLGAHSVHAALAAAAVALEEGFSLTEAAEALQELSPTLRLAGASTASTARASSTTATTPARSRCWRRSICCASCPAAARSPCSATCSSSGSEEEPATCGSATAPRRCSTC